MSSKKSDNVRIGIDANDRLDSDERDVDFAGPMSSPIGQDVTHTRASQGPAVVAFATEGAADPASDARKADASGAHSAAALHAVAGAIGPADALDESKNVAAQATSNGIGAIAGSNTIDGAVESNLAADVAIPASGLPVGGQSPDEILFIDGSIKGYELLIAGARPGVQVFVLDATLDGFEQISAALAGRQDVAAIHLVTHGDPGRVALGNTAMTVQTLADHSAQLAAWSNSLSSGADFLIYGCDVGQGIQGETLLNSLSALTGADVAASSNLTGGGPLASDWNLEVSHGAISTLPFADAATLASFTSILAKPVVDLNGPVAINVSDSFSNNNYTSGTSNLATSWTSGWAEFDASWSRAFNPAGSTNSDNSPISGNIVIPGVATGGAVAGLGTGSEVAFVGHTAQFGDAIQRELNLKAYTSAILSFSYRTAGLGTGDAIEVDVSNNNGANFVRVGTLANVTANTTATFDISSYISETTTIRFAVKSGFASGSNQQFFFDNVSIVADGNNYVTNFSEQAATPVSIAGSAAVITDPDTGQLLKSATVALTNWQAGDSFAVGALPPGISATVDNVNHIVTLASAAGDTAANFISALKLVTFSNASDIPDTTLRNINITVTDAGNETSLSSTAFIRVVPYDNPVTAVAHNVTMSALGTTTGMLFDSTSLETERTAPNASLDFDKDTAGLSTSLSTQAAKGTAVVNPDGSYTYTPNVGATGADSFTYTLTSKAQVIGTNYEYWGATISTLKGAGFPTAAPDKSSFIVGYNVDGVALDTVGGTRTANTSLDNYVVRFTNTLTIKTGGSYTFTSGSDDGSMVYIDTAGNGSFTTVVDNDLAHSYQEASGSITLAPGTYTVRVDFFENGGQEDLQVWYQGADTAGLRTNLSDVGQVLANSSTLGTVNVTIQDAGPRLALGAADAYALDDFSAAAYTNNLGTFNFASGWTESNDGTASATAGEILVTGGALQVRDTSADGLTSAISRPIDMLALSGISPTRVGYQLSFDYSTPAATNGAYVQISADGGASWTTLDTIISSGGATATTHRAYDVSNFASANTVIRFLPTGTSGVAAINFDNVRIDASQVNYSAGTYVENAAPGVAIASAGAVIGDPHGSNIASATVSIANAQVGDTLSYDNFVGGITAAFSGSTLTLSGTATAAQFATALQHVFYSSSSENPSTVARTINVAVNDAGGYVSNTATATIAVTAVNDAPLGIDASVTTANNVNVVFNTADFAFSDAEGNALAAVKIASIPLTTAGRLEWNTNGAGTWNAVTTATQPISASDIALGRLRFNPAGTFSGTGTFTFQVQDDGGTANGGVNTDPVANTFSVNVLAGSNTRPTLASNLTLVSSPEDSTAPASQTLLQLSAGAFTDPDPGSSMTGLAIVGNAATAAQGTWQYSVNGTTWTAVGTVGNTATTALALSATTQLRFLPAADFNGPPGQLSVRALDDSYTGTFTSDATRVFVGTTPFASTAISTNSYTLATSISPVNDAPVLTAGGPALTAINSSQAGNAGQLVSSFINAGTNPTTVTDVDGTVARSIAIIGTGGSAGTWQYSINNGTNWNDVGSVSASSGLLLRSTDLIRYNPDGTGAGSGAITYKAWDQSSGAAGTLVDTSLAGGTSAFSTSVDSATISVTAATSPVLSGVGSPPTFAENGAAQSIDTAIAITDGRFGTNPLTGATITIANYVNGQDVLSFANTSLIHGVWNASTGAMTLSTFSGSPTLAQYQAALASVTYSNTSDAPDTSTRTINFRVSDSLGSSNVLSATVNVSPVNDAPALGGSPAVLAYVENQAATPIDSAIIVADADSPANFNAGFLRVALTANGAAEDRLSVVTTAQISTIGSSVVYGGQTIGTIDAIENGIGVQALKIALNFNSSPAAVQALAQAIGYANSSDTPSTSTRSVSFTLNDGGNVGSGGALVSVAKVDTITVASAPEQATIADVPENTAGGSINAAEVTSSGGTTVKVTLPSDAAVGDTVNVIWGSRPAVTYTLTATDVNTNHYANVVVPTATITAQGEGAVSVTASVSHSGQTGPISAAYAVTVDTVVAAPALALLTDSGSSSTDKITSVGTLVVSGTESGALVEYSSNGTSGWSTTAPALVQGANTVYARQTDLAGNVSAASPAFTFTYDSVASTSVPNIVSVTENAGGGINASEASNGTPVAVSWTNASNPVAGDTLRIIWGGQTYDYTLTGTDASNRAATVTVPLATITAQGDGAFNVSARIVDMAGNLGTNSANFPVTVDTAAVPGTLSIDPTSYTDTGSSATDFVSSDRSFNLSLAGNEAGSTVVYQVSTNGGGTWATTTVAQNNIVAGSYQFRAQVTDAAGNVATTTPVSVVVDYTAPSATVTAITALSADTGSSATDFITNTASQTVSGTLTGTLGGGETLQVSADGGTTWVTATVAGTTWTAGGVSLAAGAGTLSARTIDAAGNATTGATHAYTLDTAAVPGTLSLTSYTDGGLSSTDFIARDQSFNLSLAGNEAGSTVVYQRSTDGGATWATTTTAQSTLANGTYQYRAQVIDTAGNVASTAPLSVTVDRTAPNAPTISSVPENAGGGINASEAADGTPVIVSLTGTNAAAGDLLTINWRNGQTVAYTLQAADITAGSATVTVPLATITAGGNGTFNATAFITDIAGNASGNSANSSVTVDTAPPAVPAPTLTAVFTDTGTSGDLITSATTAALSGTATANAQVNVYDGTALLATVTANGSGAWTYNATGLADGGHSFTAAQRDAAGNPGPASAASSMTVDATPPTVTVSDNVSGTANAATGTVTYTYTFSESVTGLLANDFAVTNGAISSITGSGTTWTVNVTPNAGVASGNLSLVLAAGAVTDVAGNQNAANTNNLQTIDTVVPALAVADNVPGTVNLATGTLAYTYTFTEPVTGLDATDFALANGTISSITGSGTTWTVNVTPNAGVAGGSISLVLAAAGVTDAAGNPNAANTNSLQAIDTVAPTVTAITVQEVHTGTAAVANGGSTFDTLPTLSGHAEAGSAITLYDGSTVLYTTTADGAGLWSFTPTTALRAGIPHSLTVKAADAAGNSNTSGAFDMAVNVGLASSATYVLKIPGEAASDNSGSSMRGAGDVNGDGFADLIIGAQFHNPTTGQQYAGRSYVIYGQGTPFNPTVPLASLNGSLLGNNGSRLSGVAAYDYSGFSVSGAGDINGDGLADVIIGAHYADPNGDRSGAAYVVFGSGSGFGSDLQLSALNGTTGFRLAGAAALDCAGISVSGAGDVNGDGYADVLVGSYSQPAGAAYLIFGKASGFAANINLASLDGTNGLRIAGVLAHDNAGQRVGAAGDINGDGYADFIIGAPGDFRVGYGVGATYVVFGKPAFSTQANAAGATLNLSTIDNGTDGFEILGMASGDGMGIGISSAGDLNGDGFADIIVSARHAVVGGITSGESYVVFGHAGGFDPVIDLSKLSPSGTTGTIGGFHIFGGAADSRTGYSVSAAGDINGDGYGDLLVGAPGVYGSPLSGDSYVIFGKANFTADMNLATLGGFDGFRVSGVLPGDASGYNVSAAGDINGDGFADIAVSSARALPSSNALAGAGETYVIFGSTLITGSQIHVGGTGNDTLTGTSAADNFIGGQGDDTMLGNGGKDAFSGGAGNDAVHLGASGQAAIDFVKIDGGSGYDTLVLDGSGVTLDLTAPGAMNKVQGIERIDLGSGNNSLVLNIHDVLNISDTDNRLFVMGTGADSVTSTGQGWAPSASGNLTDHGITYLSYTLGGAAYNQGMANLLIDQHLLAANVHLS